MNSNLIIQFSMDKIAEQKSRPHVKFMLISLTTLLISVSNRDFTNGLSCSRNEETGLPDEDCVFVPNAEENKNIRSSIMGAPFLKKVTSVSSLFTWEEYICKSNFSGNILL